MRGSIVGLSLVGSLVISVFCPFAHRIGQDDGLGDLARKFNVTLEAIALQTRHIVDEMNAKGHSIRSIYVSGGQTKNIPLMQLFADVCDMPVVLPHNSGAAVVLGAAMLGRFAAELRPDDADVQAQNEAKWNIMVRLSQVLHRRPREYVLTRSVRSR